VTSTPIDGLLDALGRIEAAPGAWAEVSLGYRGGRATPAGRGFTEAHARAYAVGRAPATAAAVAAVFAEAADRIEGWSPRSIIDVGAGLGTASWAASEIVPSLVDIGLVERSEAMIELGQELGARSAAPRIGVRQWRRADVSDLGDRRVDVVLASYVLSELDEKDAVVAVDAWWAATEGELVIVDTGTPAGFARVLAARGQLLEAGASIVAPCPSAGPCPMAGHDWCHFAVRLARSDLHRKLKGAELSFEDEKFSYLVVSRSPSFAARGRVVRHPQTRSGHVRLQVCHDDQVTEEVVSKSRGELYRWARKAEWGDAVPAEVFDRG
jgi:ribosomal protein RSM22 (predicted rRNA methylase)